MKTMREVRERLKLIKTTLVQEQDIKAIEVALLTLAYENRYKIVCCQYSEEPNEICLETKEEVYKWLENNKELIRYDNFIILIDKFTDANFFIDTDKYTTSSAIEKEFIQGFEEVLDA